MDNNSYQKQSDLEHNNKSETSWQTNFILHNPAWIYEVQKEIHAEAEQCKKERESSANNPSSWEKISMWVLLRNSLVIIFIVFFLLWLFN